MCGWPRVVASAVRGRGALPSPAQVAARTPRRLGHPLPAGPVVPGRPRDRDPTARPRHHPALACSLASPGVDAKVSDLVLETLPPRVPPTPICRPQRGRRWRLRRRHRRLDQHHHRRRRALRREPAPGEQSNAPGRLSQSVVLTDINDVYQGRTSSVWVVNRGTMPVGSTLLTACASASVVPMCG